MRRLLTRFPWLPDVLTLVAFVLGAVWRYVHIFKWHDPNKYVYSDMKMYVDLAKRISKPDYVLRIGDVTHPPGLTEVLAFFFKRDPNFYQVLWLQFAVCALVPVAVGLLGWLAFTKNTGRLSLVVTSFYFPFVDFGGYFLAEIYLALFATLTLVCWFGAIKIGDGPKTPKRTIGLVLVAVLGGVFFSIACAMKMVAAPAILGFCVVHVLFTKVSTFRVKAMVLALMLIAAAPLTYKTVDRCTKANKGEFCAGSNKAASDFLLGHYGRVQGITWKDPKVPGHVGFGSPAAYQHGYRDKPEVPFLITDTKKNNEYAWRWIKKNPMQSLVLSFEHVWDIFGGSLPWPTVATGYWASSQAFHYIFIMFLFFPSLILLLDVARQRGFVALIRSTEVAVLAPIFGVCLSVFIATGEARYRIPWDASFIVLAVEFYRRLKIPFWEVKPAEDTGEDKPEVATATEDDEYEDEDEDEEPAPAPAPDKVA